MKLHLDRLRNNVQQATTEDLLDRITVYRVGLEEEAIELIEEELLKRRGITPEDIQHHAQARSECLREENGMVLECSFCRRPSVQQRWGWHYCWGKLPVFPRRLRYCYVHLAKHFPEKNEEAEK